MSTKIAWFFTRYGIALGIGVALTYLFLAPWLNPPKTQTLYRIVDRPYRASGELLKGVDTKDVVVPAFEPTARQKAKIEKKIGGELPKGKVIAGGRVGKLRYGGYAIAALPPIGEDGEQSPAEITIYPAKPPVFESLLREREVGVYVGFGKDLQRAYSLEFRQGLFRVGPLNFEAKLGVTQTPALSTDYYALVGAKVRF